MYYISRGDCIDDPLSYYFVKLLMKKGNFRLLIWNQHDRVSIRRSVELGKKAVNNVSRLIWESILARYLRVNVNYSSLFSVI